MRLSLIGLAISLGTMAHLTPLPDIPAINLTFPSTSLALSAAAFIKQHESVNTVHHSIRSAYWALILSKKHPDFIGKALDMESVVFSILMHDMGWATTKSLLSNDKRFEVDGANIARDFLTKHTSVGCNPENKSSYWGKHRQQLVWDTIALHTTPSIGSYKEPEVSLANLAIGADFYGSNFPGNLISDDEYNAVANLFPRAGFADELIQIMCGLCRDKASTTFDNVVGDYGLQYGLDGLGGGLDVYTDAWQKNHQASRFVGALRYLERNSTAQSILPRLELKTETTGMRSKP